MYRPWLAQGDDDVEYDFAEASAQERVEATDLVAGAAIPYRWDPGFVLRIGPASEEAVDALFGHDSDERQALKTLVSVAATLAEEPGDDEAMVQLADATGVVTTAETPEGVNRVLWSTVGYLARQLLNLTEDDEVLDEDVIAAAAALKAVLP